MVNPVNYVSGMPDANFDHDAVLYHLDREPIRTALHISTDPVTGVAEFNLYFDDGHGNGNGILNIPLAELRWLIKNHNEKRG